MRPYKITGIGEILWDLLPTGRQLGGAPANVIYHCSRIGGDATLVSSIGQDQNGDEIVETLNQKKIHHHLTRSDHPTGTVEVVLDKKGSPEYTIHEDVAWDFLEYTREIDQIAQKTDAVCYGSLACRNTVSFETIVQFVKTVPDDALKVLDINLRPPYICHDVLRKLIREANILKLNQDEFTFLCSMLDLRKDDPGIMGQLKEKFHLDHIVLTRGSNGSLIYQDETNSAFYRMDPVEAKDSVGAGDAFTAGLIMGLLQKIPLDRINQAASAAAAFVCTQSGATPRLPESIISLF